jgi:hypothetical protein
MQLFYEGMHPFGSRACICVAFVLVPGCFMRACIRLGPGHAFVLHLFWSRACIVEGQGRRRWTAPASERVKIDESADKVDWCTG